MPAIACSCSALGTLGIMLTESAGTAPRTFSNTSIRHEIIYENVGTTRKLEHTNAITGSLSRLSSGVREKSYLSQGTIAVQPSPRQLTTWLPRIFGGPLSGTNVALADNLPSFDILVYRENGIFQYTNCVVAQAMLRGKTSNGGDSTEFMELLINVIGNAELVDAVSWPNPEPALVTTLDTLPYVFPETEFDIGGNLVEYEAFSMMIDNNLDVRFFNNNFAQCVRSTGRNIEIELQAPFTCDNLDYALLLNTTASTGSFSMAAGNTSTDFAFPALRNTFVTPTIAGRQMIPLKFGLEAYATSATKEVVITHDATL
jgi:hypothetical protein